MYKCIKCMNIQMYECMINKFKNSILYQFNIKIYILYMQIGSLNRLKLCMSVPKLINTFMHFYDEHFLTFFKSKTSHKGKSIKEL